MTIPPPALLIAGPGTQDDAGAESFRDFVRELGRRHPDLPLAGGFTEPASPPLDEAVAESVEQGVRRFVAVALALRSDIPWQRAGQRWQERHPGVSIAYGRPLGPHPSLLAVLERRLDAALGTEGRRPGDRADVTVLLVGRGSTDPEANAEVHRAARLLWEGRGYAGVEPAFVSLAAPDVPSGLDRCVKLGAKRIVVLPYFLLTGALPERAWQQAEGWAAAHPETDVRAADVIGPEPELLDLVRERYEAAVHAGHQDDDQHHSPAHHTQDTPSQHPQDSPSHAL